MSYWIPRETLPTMFSTNGMDLSEPTLDGGGVVVMHTGAAVDREAIMLTSSGTHFGISIEEC